MTETENKFFSVDVSNDIHIVNLHETLEQAKQSCLDGAVEAHEFADDMCDHEDFASNDLPNAVYGIVLGKAVCKKKQLSEEEKKEYGSDLVLEKPELVEFPQNNGWISVEDRLPSEREDVLICTGRGEIKIAWRDDVFFMSLLTYHLSSVTHWRPLPPLPKTE